MILYHGSYAAIEKPDLAFSRLRTDFGRGFYLTPLREQAERWSQRYLRAGGDAVVSIYEFSAESGGSLPLDFTTLKFDAHDVGWLDFVTACRLGKSADTGWDLVIGGVANDKVFDTLQLYFDGLVSAEEAIGRLRYSEPNLQYCFKSQSLIDGYIQFIGSEVTGR